MIRLTRLRDGMVRALLSEQREDGAWQIYFEAPAGDINATVEAYAALQDRRARAADETAAQGARLDRVQGRLVEGPRLHPLLACPDRRLAMGEDAQHSSRGDPLSGVVSVLDLQFRLLGARHLDADQRPVGHAPGSTPARGRPAGRTVPGGPRRV